MSATPGTGISIVIPTWNGLPLLQRFLPSVLCEAERMQAAAGLPLEVVVSDDGSTDATAAWLAQHAPQVRLARAEANGGFALAANAGVAAARFAIAVLLNNDLELLPGALTPIPAWFDRPGCFGVTLRAQDIGGAFATGGKLGRFRRGFWQVWDNYDAPAPDPSAPPLPTFYLAGGFCAFRREAFLDIGGFDPRFAPYYWEDVDLSYRARKAGWWTAYEPRSGVRHAGSATVVAHRPPFARQTCIHRNRLWFHWKNLDRGRLVRHLFWCHLVLLQLAFKGDFAYHCGYVQALRRLWPVLSERRRQRPRWRHRDPDLTVTPPPS